MRSTILGSGRHRFGLPGLIPVRHFVAVHQTSFFARLFGFGRRAGRHAFEDRALVDHAAGTLQTATA